LVRPEIALLVLSGHDQDGKAAFRTSKGRGRQGAPFWQGIGQSAHFALDKAFIIIGFIDIERALAVYALADLIEFSHAYSIT